MFARTISSEGDEITEGNHLHRPFGSGFERLLDDVNFICSENNIYYQLTRVVADTSGHCVLNRTELEFEQVSVNHNHSPKYPRQMLLHYQKRTYFNTKQ
jgi:hypothetical protein